MTKTKKSKTQVKVKSYTRKDGTRVRSSQRSIETNNIRNNYELQRRRKGKELLRDIGSDLTLGLIKPSEITKKRTSVRKAQAAGVLLNRVDRRGLAEATRVATNDYQINPNSKKALAEINKLENRARIAGTKPERYRKLAALYEKEMEKGGYQGMKYRGTDFSSSTTNQIEFKRGKDKKKRKRKSRRNEALIAAASIGGGAGIGGAQGFIRGRGGLGGTLERMYRLDVGNFKFDKKARKVAKPTIDEGFLTAKAGDKWLKENRKIWEPVT